MTGGISWRRGLLLSAACLLALAAGDARADQMVAQRLFLQATTLTVQARNEPDPARRLRLLERARDDLRTIVAAHAETALASQLAKGTVVGGFDPAAFEREVAVARAAAGPIPPGPPQHRQSAAMPAPAQPPAAAAAAAPPPVPVPQDSRKRLPVAPSDPKTTAGKILGDVVGAVENFAASDPSLAVTVSRPVSAVQRGDTVAVTFPGLTVAVDEETTLEMGDIVLDVTPQDDARYAFSLRLPAEIVGYAGGQPDGRISYAAEPVTGVWAPDMGIFLRFYLNLRDVRVEQVTPEPMLLLGVGSVTAEQRGEVQSDKLSADFHMELRDLVANEGQDAQQLRVGRMAFSTKALDFDLAAWRRISDALQSDPNGEKGEASLAALQFLAQGGWARIGTDLSLTDVDLTQAGQPLAAMGGMHLGFDLDGRPQAGATMAVKVGLDRMKADEVPVGDLPPEMMPHSFAIDAALERMPLMAMAESAQKSPSETLEGELMSLMMTSRPNLNIAQVSMASQQVQMSLTGAIAVDPESALMSSGGLTVKVAGLDQVKAYLDRQSKKDKSLQQYIPSVVMLRGLGNDTQLSGTKAKEFKVVAAKDGAITINGTPWQALLPGQEEPPKNAAQPNRKRQ